MLKNYFKIAFRNLRRNKGFTILNVLGLAIGLASCLLIFVYIQDELSYDRFHQKAEQIYRVTYSTNDEGTPTNANGSFGVGPALKRDFPQVETYTRLRKAGQLGTKSLVRYEDKNFYEERFFFADSTVFEVFSFHLVKGNPEAALARPGTVIITEATAEKYFSNEDPLGKTLVADPFGEGEMIEFEVTGVMRNLPRNSHVYFDFLASIYSTSDDLNQFAGFQQVYTYIVLHENASEEPLEAKLLDFIHRNWTDDPWYTIQLQPLLDIHLHSHLRSEIEPNGNIRYVYIFAIIAIFVLVIACINFMNMVTARSTKRAREVGVRKALGAGRNQLVRQFLAESILLSLASGILAIVFVDLFTSLFNNMTGKEIDILAYAGPFTVAVFVGFIIVVGILAGSYPALMLSRFKPVNTLKGNVIEVGSDAFLRKGLVVFQFAISMALIATTVIVYSQMNYIQTKDLGYAEDQIMALPLNNELRKHYEAFRSELLQSANIINMTTSSLVPTMGSSHTSFKVEGMERGQSYSTYFVDRNFVETYGLDLLAGSDIERVVNGESGGDFLFSELAVNEAGWETAEEIIGRRVTWDEFEGRVSGVVNDMHIYSFREKVYSSAFLITPIKYHRYLSIQLNPENLSETMGYIERVWSDMFPGYPFEYFFLDESFEQMHRSDMRLAETITWFALLAIFVACLGLFGLSAFAAEQKVKEIGIRKVLGARVGQIVVLFSKEFLKLTALGTVIAVPAAWYFASIWLKGFAYRIEIGVMPFIMAGTVLMLIALLSISYNSIRAALVNPAQSLRSE